MAFTVPDRVDELVAPVAEIKTWTKVAVVERAVKHLIATDPELADLRSQVAGGTHSPAGAARAEADPSEATGGADATQVNQTPAVPAHAA